MIQISFWILLKMGNEKYKLNNRRSRTIMESEPNYRSNKCLRVIITYTYR